MPRLRLLKNGVVVALIPIEKINHHHYNNDLPIVLRICILFYLDHSNVKKVDCLFSSL